MIRHKDDGVMVEDDELEYEDYLVVMHYGVDKVNFYYDNNYGDPLLHTINDPDFQKDASDEQKQDDIEYKQHITEKFSNPENITPELLRTTYVPGDSISEWLYDGKDKY